MSAHITCDKTAHKYERRTKTAEVWSKHPSSHPFEEQFAEGAKLKAQIRENLRRLGYSR